jgi:hypothetical protein
MMPKEENFLKIAEYIFRIALMAGKKYLRFVPKSALVTIREIL